MNGLHPGEETVPVTGISEDAPQAVPQQWAIIEIFGHRRHVGIVSEAEQYGSKMLRIDVPGAEPGTVEATFFYGGASIFGLTPITEERGLMELSAIRGRAAPARLGLRSTLRAIGAAPDDEDDMGDYGLRDHGDDDV